MVVDEVGSLLKGMSHQCLLNLLIMVDELMLCFFLVALGLEPVMLQSQ